LHVEHIEPPFLLSEPLSRARSYWNPSVQPGGVFDHPILREKKLWLRGNLLVIQVTISRKKGGVPETEIQSA